ncbi:hypothetical protein PTSG_01408 [Salpingoeca rosetta]|uniref:COX assembly mitochondrial protein n=1 Tax=Salpingoeca rosetta (strain ATCC 50818 / BSB-021) TaxID=946362 RepID=F2U094_SALR5|nr:uncharacterized protein PTSG_01408 [Salpingoeca rosetta]EGD80822.1 hypothetical protein PTSG_01408 [Salpingoeca rosetta]|eukprot:XP_004997383.1 hypothetical protein PTSG_01408 [Salpingoeca rosetta]
MFGKREQEPSMLNMNDDHLRHVEKDIVIPKMVKEAARIACADVVKEFEDCARGRTISVVFACREQNKKLTECVLANSTPEHFERQTQIFLEKRKEARLAEEQQAAQEAQPQQQTQQQQQQQQQ